MAKSNMSGASGKARSGGGALMNKNVKVTTTHGSPNTRKVSPEAVANIGIKKGNHSMDGGTVKRPDVPLYKEVKAFVRMGNDLAKNVGKGGPGSGRTINPTGSQMQHGPVNRGESTAGSFLPGGTGGPGSMGFGKDK